MRSTGHAVKVKVYVTVHVHAADADQIQEQLGNILTGVMNMAENQQSLQEKVDGIIAAAAKEKTEADEKWAAAQAKAAAADAHIVDLTAQIAALQAAGAGAVTQEQLDALGSKLDTARTAVQGIVDPDVAAPQNPPVETVGQV